MMTQGVLPFKYQEEKKGGGEVRRPRGLVLRSARRGTRMKLPRGPEFKKIPVFDAKQQPIGLITDLHFDENGDYNYKLGGSNFIK